MIGLMFLVFFAIYFFLSALIIGCAVWWAKNRGRSPWRWGFVAAFMMYNLVFWDWIPSVALQSYYCKTEAGFWVYKDPKKWLSENPNVQSELTYSDLSKTSKIDEKTFVYHLNERLDWVNKKDLLWPEIRRYERFVVDKKIMKF